MSRGRNRMGWSRQAAVCFFAGFLGWSCWLTAQDNAADQKAVKPRVANALQTALDRAAKEGKYLLLLLYDEQDAAARRMKEAVNKAMSEFSKKATFFECSVEAPGVEALMRKHEVAGNGLPVLLAISPSDVVTRTLEYAPTKEELGSALQSAALVAVIKAIRERKAILLTFTNEKFSDHRDTVEAVKAFAEDFLEMVGVVVADPREADDLALQCGVSDSIRASHVLIVLNGRIAYEISSPATKREVAKAFETATTRGAGCGT